MKTILSVLILVSFMPYLSHAQLINISGFIKSSISNNAVENASVFESNSGIGTISNQNGYFKLTLQPGDRNISFAEDGFKTVTKHLELRKDTIFSIVLEPGKSIAKQETRLHASNKSKRQYMKKLRLE